MKRISTLTTTALSVLLAEAITVYAQTTGETGVKLLEGIGDIQVNSTPPLGEYLRNGYIFALQAAGVIAVVQLIIAGIQYIYLGFSAGNIGAAKTRVTNTFYGLAAVFSTYLILQIVNPDLVNKQFTNVITPLNDQITNTQASREGTQTAPGTGTATRGTADIIRDNSQLPPGTIPGEPGTIIRPCPTCTNILTQGASIDINGHTNTLVTPTLASKIVSMDRTLDSQSVGWRINEAWPPTVLHQSEGHWDGNAIDAGITSVTPENLNTFSSAAKQAGLTAKWETTSPERTRLRAAGYTGEFGAISSTPHFHIQ